MSNKLEIYITVMNNSKKKSLCAIKAVEKSGKDELLIVPSYSKLYHGEKQKSNLHTTRHYSFLHRTLYIDGKKATEYPISSYSEFERTPLNELTEYEIVECFQVSPIILDREITKDYNKKEKLEFVLTAYENQYYNVYIFVNPLNNTSLYDDLKKYNIQFNIYQREHYEIVIAAEIKIGIKNTAICNFLQMYIKTHQNYGIGAFRPL